MQVSSFMLSETITKQSRKIKVKDINTWLVLRVPSIIAPRFLWGNRTILGCKLYQTLFGAGAYTKGPAQKGGPFGHARLADLHALVNNNMLTQYKKRLLNQFI